MSLSAQTSSDRGAKGITSTSDSTSAARSAAIPLLVADGRLPPADAHQKFDWLMGERRPGWRVQLVPWSGMFGGAVLGGLLEHRYGLAALMACGGFALALAIVSLLIPRRWLRRYMAK